MFLSRFRTLTSMLILMLLTMQSVALKADVHQFHQTQTQINLSEHGLHEQEAHEHMHVAQMHDCGHCCHCHGGSHFYLISHIPFLMASMSVEIFHDSAIPLVQIARIPAFRPPIV